MLRVHRWRVLEWLALGECLACAGLPATHTQLRSPTGHEVALECDLSYAPEGSEAEGCRFVPGEWPVRRGDEIKLKEQVVPLGCKARLPLIQSGGTPLQRDVPSQPITPTREVTCVSVWHGSGLLYGWKGVVDGPETSEQTVVQE